MLLIRLPSPESCLRGLSNPPRLDTEEHITFLNYSSSTTLILKCEYMNVLARNKHADLWRIAISLLSGDPKGPLLVCLGIC